MFYFWDFFTYGSARRFELLQSFLGKLEVRIRRRHLLEQRSRFVHASLAKACQRQEKLHRQLIGVESHADLQRIGSGIESVTEQLHQPQIALNHRIVFVQTGARGELRADEPEASGVAGAERL